MTTSSFSDFEAQARAKGFDEVLERRWDPLTELGMHSHPFDASVVVVQGEMWLTTHGVTRHLFPGDTFELARGIPHTERYGAEGAAYWVARRGPSA